MTDKTNLKPGLPSRSLDTLKVTAVFYMESVNEEHLVARIQRRAIRENRLDDAN